jgi:hypothetical protein
MEIKIDPEALTQIEDLRREIAVLNEHLTDLKKMVAPLLGWRVIVPESEAR